MTADTNVLVRAVIGDDPVQSGLAEVELADAERVAIPVTVLCEFVWVLSRRYKVASADIAAALRRLTDAENVAVNRPAVQAGLALLDAGGDFADGVHAYEGKWLGAERFVSFDKEAIRLLKARGEAVKFLG